MCCINMSASFLDPTIFPICFKLIQHTRQTGAGVNEQMHGHSREVSTDGSVATHGLGKRTVSSPVAARHGTRLHLPSDYSDVRAEP